MPDELPAYRHQARRGTVQSGSTKFRCCTRTGGSGNHDTQPAGKQHKPGNGGPAALNCDQADTMYSHR